MPEEAFLYASPYKLTKRTASSRRRPRHQPLLHQPGKRPELNKAVGELDIINCHLGNGGSLRHQERPVRRTSMGLTPAGKALAMGTRSGDIDPATNLCSGTTSWARALPRSTPC
ncbi:hypothetical protein ACNKHU_14065 [Shigella flexneri]